MTEERSHHRRRVARRRSVRAAHHPEPPSRHPRTRMVMDMLTIYLHYEDENEEAHILQRSMMRRHVSHYDFIMMIEEVGFNASNFLYYAKKNPNPKDNNLLIHIDDPSVVINMLSDPDFEKSIHLYVSKEKETEDIGPSDHPNDSARLQDGGVSAEGVEHLIVRSSQRKLRRSKRLNVIQVNDQHNDEDVDFNNGEQYIAQGYESQALEDEEGRVHNQLSTEIVKRKRTSLPVVWNMQPGQRIVVKCNEEGQPIREEGAILGKFLDTVARLGGLCPLNINDWRDLKKKGREETILQCVQTKFVYPKACEKWILKSIGRDWRKFKSSLKKTIFNPAIEKNPDIRRKALYKLCLDDVDKDQWRGLVKFWNSKKGKALTTKNLVSRSLVKNSHNAGTKSYACWSEDIRQADPEKKRPHRATVYLATHKKKDNAKNKEKNERLDKLENIIAQRPALAQNVNGRVAWEGDALQEVLGQEKAGQVHGMGLLPTPKQVYGRTPRYLKNINMTTSDGSPCDGEDDLREEVARMKEQIRRLEDRNNKEGYGNTGIEEENLQSNNNVSPRLPILHSKTKRVQCDGPVDPRPSMQHGMSGDNSLLLSREKDGEHDNVNQYGEHDNANQLLIQQKPSLLQDPIIHSVLEVRETRDWTVESVARLDQQSTKNKRPTKRRRTSSFEDGSKVVLKTSTYPNKRTVAYATIKSTDPATKAGGIELGTEFLLVAIDEPIKDNEELVREVGDCKTIGDAFSEGFCIAWPSAFIRKKDK
uniref:Uncharacterized protein n=1 Tax=Avena sativa TaxID=4498 RepID=A0ACD5VF94_AVESA